MNSFITKFKHILRNHKENYPLSTEDYRHNNIQIASILIYDNAKNVIYKIIVYVQRNFFIISLIITLSSQNSDRSAFKEEKGILVSTCIIQLIFNMFCCSSQHFEVTIAKAQQDFNNPYLYHQSFKEHMHKSGRSQGLLKQSSLKIDQNRGWEMKQGHDKQAQFWLQACDSFNKEILLTKNNREDRNENVWRVLGKEQTHEIKIGDRIKLGFMELLVGNMQIQQENSEKSAQLHSQQHCRYCLLNSYTLDDPLLALCKCSGSVKCLHLGCLRRWLMMKMETQYSNQMAIYTTEKFQCQICRNPWPIEIYINGKKQALLSFDEEMNEQQEQIYAFSPFIVLHTLTLDENNIQIHVFIKVYIDEQFNIGDDENLSDLAFDQIGISPLHCSIRIQNGQFIIKDEGSQCGTLVTLHQQENFTSKRSIFLQYKSFLIKIGRQSSFFDCLAPEEDCTMKFRIEQPKF